MTIQEQIDRVLPKTFIIVSYEALANDAIEITIWDETLDLEFTGKGLCFDSALKSAVNQVSDWNNTASDFMEKNSGR